MPDSPLSMLKVKSSNVHSVGYHAEKQDLYVKFHSGATYVYRKVPRRHAVGLVSADSVGAYLNTYIKDAYDADRVG